MAWNLFANTGSLMTDPLDKNIASTSTAINYFNTNSIAITNNTVHYIRPYVQVLSGVIHSSQDIQYMTGGVVGSVVTLVANIDTTGYTLPITHSSNNSKDSLFLRDGSSVGLYNGESVTFQYTGSYWVEINRSFREIIDFASYLPGAGIALSAVTLATSVTMATFPRIDFDPSPIEIVITFPYILVTNFATGGNNFEVLSYVNTGVSTSYIETIGFQGTTSSVYRTDQGMTCSVFYTPNASSVQYSFALCKGNTNSVVSYSGGPLSSGGNREIGMTIKRTNA